MRNKSHWISNKLLPIDIYGITQDPRLLIKPSIDPSSRHHVQHLHLQHSSNNFANTCTSTIPRVESGLERNAFAAILRSAKQKLQGRRLRAWSHGRRGVSHRPSTLSTSCGCLSPRHKLAKRGHDFLRTIPIPLLPKKSSHRVSGTRSWSSQFCSQNVGPA